MKARRSRHLAGRQQPVIRLGAHTSYLMKTTSFLVHLRYSQRHGSSQFVMDDISLACPRKLKPKPNSSAVQTSTVDSHLRSTSPFFWSALGSRSLISPSP